MQSTDAAKKVNFEVMIMAGTNAKVNVNKKRKAPEFKLALFGGDTAYSSSTSLRPSTTRSAGFGDEIQDVDRVYASQREPIAHFITAFVGNDIFTNWFTINDVDTEAPDEQLDADVQAELKKIGAQNAFTEGAIWERVYGESYLVLALDDAKDEKALAAPASESAEIVSISVYPKTKVRGDTLFSNADAPNYGQVKLYELDRGSGKKTRVHSSRVIRLRTRHDGASVLDPIWDYLICLRNINWGMAQTMYRYGSGFPVVTVNGASYEQLKTMAEEERIANLMSRTFFLKNESMEIKFEGAQGSALNPLPYYIPMIENISAGTKIPAAILRGVQAGALTGSEVNEREYAMFIRSLQKLYDEPLRLVVDRVMKALGKAIEYEIEWKSVVHLSDMAVADMDLKVEQTNEKRLLYMSVDEVREKMGLEPIGGEEGATIPGLSKPAPELPPGQPAPDKKEGEGEGNADPLLKELSGAEVIDKSGDGGANRHKHAMTLSSDKERRPYEHPEMVADLKDLIHRARRKEISKEIALEKARAVINRHVDDEIARAKAYLASRTGRPMPLLPTEKSAQYDRKRAEYMTDFNTILADVLSKGRK